MNIQLTFSHYTTGLIISAPTGITWTTQVGGTCCAHPVLEGFFVPLEGYDMEAFDPLRDRFNEPYDVETVRKLLHYTGMKEFLEPITREIPLPVAWTKDDGWERCLWDGETLLMSEAWVPVRIRRAPLTTDGWITTRNGLLTGHGNFSNPLAGELAVLTYPNSD